MLVAAGLAVWHRMPPQAEGRGAGFNVLLITLDTTRADHLACYGHPEIATPNIDALARQGTMFTQCTAPAPITLPSHASIMTGTYPYVHGVRENAQFQLSESNVTLAELLKTAGYSTAAHTAAYVVNRDYGLAQGFDTYLDARRRVERKADEVCDGTIKWLRANTAKQFFVWTHFFDPHRPYEPPHPFNRQYDDPYVGEIAFVDQQVGRLINELRRLGLERKTLVVLTADHGEGRGQHGEDTHLYFVYDTTMHVPLIFHCPGVIPGGRVVPAQVRLIDVTPTVLAFLGRPAKTDAQGVSLLGLISGRTDDLGLAAYGESLGGFLVMGLSPLRCLRVDKWKYIHAPTPELYQIREDPGETRNLAEAEPVRLADMRDELETLIAEAPPSPSLDEAMRTPSGDEIRKLMTMGYVAGSSRGGQTENLLASELDLFEPVGPDPKDHVESIVIEEKATYALIHEDFSQAEALLRRLRKVFPHSPGVGDRLARALFLQGRDAEAIAVYKEITAEHPDFSGAYYGIGKLLSRGGKIDEAIPHFRKAIELDPTYAEAHYDLGVSLARQGMIDEAIEHYRTAVRLRPTYVNALVNLAIALGGKGELDEAVLLYERALRLEPADPTIYYNLGNARLRQGNLAEAALRYEEALRLRPDFALARNSLHAVRQKLAEQRGASPGSQ